MSYLNSGAFCGTHIWRPDIRVRINLIGLSRSEGAKPVVETRHNNRTRMDTNVCNAATVCHLLVAALKYGAVQTCPVMKCSRKMIGDDMAVYIYSKCFKTSKNM